MDDRAQAAWRGPAQAIWGAADQAQWDGPAQSAWDGPAGAAWNGPAGAGGMVLVEHGMVLLEQCVVGLLEHHGTVASGRDSSCPAASQAMHPKPFLAFLTPLGNPSLLEVIPGESS